MSLDDYKKQDSQQNIFEDRINALRIKGKKRGKRYSFIGIIISVIIFFVSMILGYIVFEQISQIFNKMNYDNQKNTFQSLFDPENRCKGNSCCLASLEKMRKKKFEEADHLGGCGIDEMPNSLRCENSVIWCEPKEQEEESGISNNL